MKKISAVAVLTLIIGISACSTKEPDESAPITDASSLINAYIEARGGDQALATLTRIQLNGQYINPDGLNIEMVDTYYSPFHLIKIHDIGIDSYMGFNGTTTWWHMPNYGVKEPTLIPREDIRSFVIEYDAALDGPYLHVSAEGLRFEGKVPFRNKEAWKLSIENSDEYIVHHYFDVDSSLEIRRQFVRRSGKGVLTINYLKHEDLEGTFLPTKNEYWMDGKLIGTFEVMDVEIDPIVDHGLLNTHIS